MSEISNLSPNTNVSFIPMEALGQFGSLDLRRIMQLYEVKDGYKYFRNDDVLVAKITPCFENNKGAIAVNLHNGIAFGTTELHVLRANTKINACLLFYITISHPFRLIGQSFMYGAAGQKRIPDDFLVTFPIGIPPGFVEQRGIANFLDRETTKIDALIFKQERLIELLQEKRAALITHAVTKGLDPNVPMKDSGVKWLGEIPAHWGTVSFKRLGEFQGGVGFPDKLQGRIDEELPFYKVSDTNNIGNEMYMKYHNNTISTETASCLRAFIFPKGAIIFPKVGAALLLNKRRILTRPSCIDNNMMGFIHCTGDLRWLYYWMCGLDLGRLANPGAVPSINESQLRDIVVPLPPEEEQKTIGLYLANSNSALNKTVDKISKAVSLLREYRTALISAAVTGKIDVREEVSSA